MQLSIEDTPYENEVRRTNQIASFIQSLGYLVSTDVLHHHYRGETLFQRPEYQFLIMLPKTKEHPLGIVKRIFGSQVGQFFHRARHPIICKLDFSSKQNEWSIEFWGPKSIHIQVHRIAKHLSDEFQTKTNITHSSLIQKYSLIGFEGYNYF